MTRVPDGLPNALGELPADQNVIGRRLRQVFAQDNRMGMSDARLRAGSVGERIGGKAERGQFREQILATRSREQQIGIYARYIGRTGRRIERRIANSQVMISTQKPAIAVRTRPALKFRAITYVGYANAGARSFRLCFGRLKKSRQSPSVMLHEIGPMVLAQMEERGSLHYLIGEASLHPDRKRPAW
jgi:hypothetical protein